MRLPNVFRGPIALTNIQYSPELSEETFAFTADLKFHGELASVRNDGRGGANLVRPYGVAYQIDRYLKDRPAEGGDTISTDYLISLMVEEAIQHAAREPEPTPRPIGRPYEPDYTPSRDDAARGAASYRERSGGAYGHRAEEILYETPHYWATWEKFKDRKLVRIWKHSASGTHGVLAGTVDLGVDSVRRAIMEIDKREAEAAYADEPSAVGPRASADAPRSMHGPLFDTARAPSPPASSRTALRTFMSQPAAPRPRAATPKKKTARKKAAAKKRS